MYFTSLPDHSQPGFDERAHFSQFKKHNIIFNALSSNKHCDDHVGCLSMKTVLTGEECYGLGSRQVMVRPGQFLILNDDQNYSCHIDRDVATATLSIFFKKDFAASICQDVLYNEQVSLDNPFRKDVCPEFFQTLIDVDPKLQRQLTKLTTSLQDTGLEEDQTDEYLIFILRHLIQVHQHESRKMMDVKALRASTQTEIYKRLCIVKDLLHSNYMDTLDLQTISRVACLSVPQLVRQFKSVFKVTPHQYLMQIRLSRATELMKTHSDLPLREIAWQIGFENASAFGRAFKATYGVQPGQFKSSSSEKEDSR
jgi:AraC family transcriptional regulator